MGESNKSFDMEEIDIEETGGTRYKDFARSASATSEDDRITFSWDNITVTATTGGSKIPFRKSKKQIKTIVNGVSGYVKPGELIAIMGASGAGKTTLLNSLNFRNLDNLKVSGNRFANGMPVSPNSLTALSAYIQQEDLFIGTLTPREHLEFQALVRMDREIPRKKRMQRVEEVIIELGLSKCAKTVIGVPGRIKGISGGEKKRLAFASEVLTNPPLFFCDEPTSGLDSYMAANVVEMLQNLARGGKSIICTIHQPSSQIFAMFDRVLLMAEGQVAYLGDIDRAYKFFTDVGYPCPPMYNPSDHYVQVLAVTPSEQESSRERIKAICDEFHSSADGKAVAKEVEYQKTHKQNVSRIEKEAKKTSPYKATWFEQFRALFWRSFLSVIKEPMIVQVNLIQTIFIALILGVVFLGQEMNQDGVMNINGALFIIITNLNFGNVFAVVNVFCLELPIFKREHFNGNYRVDVYYLTKQLAELPIFILTPVIFTAIFYYMVGLNPDVDRFFICMAIAVCLVQCVISFGYMVSCMSSSLQMALGTAPPLMIPLLIFGGFFLKSDTIPAWLSWIQYISWFYYSNEALVINQWRGVTLPCPPGEEVPLPDDVTIPCPWDTFPQNQVCDADGNLNIDIPDNSTLTLPSICIFENDEMIYDFYGYKEKNFAFDIIMLIVLSLAMRFIGFLALLLRTRRTMK